MHLSKNVLLGATLFFSYISVLLYYVIGGGVGQGLIVISLILLIINFIDKNIKKNYLIYFCFFVLIFFVFSLFSRSYPFYYSIILLLLYGGFSLLFAYGIFSFENKIKISTIFYFIFILFLWLSFFKLGFMNPDAYNEIFHEASRNVVSAFLLLITILVGSSFYVKGYKQPIYIYIITLISSVMLFGRSGIAISLTMILMALYFNYGRRVYSLVFFIPIIYFIYMQYSVQIEYFLMEETSFKYGLESPRKIMLEEYTSNIFNSNTNWFFGRDYKECCYTVLFYDNPHNSFIVGHARFGMVHTLFFTGLLFFLVFYIRKKFLLVFFIVLIYSRYIFDQLGLFSPLDFVLFYLFILVFYKGKYV